MGDPNTQNRGRDASTPWQIPATGWKDVVWRVWNELREGGIVDRAASIAFYGVLALYPALTGTVSIYGLLADPSDVVRQVNSISAAMPPLARRVVLGELTAIAHRSAAELTLGVVASLLFAVVSASSGVAAMMRGINAAYDEQETRGWLRHRLLALGLTVTLSLFVVVSVALITLLPVVLTQLGLGAQARAVLQFSRWPLLGVATMLGLAVLYRYGPDRTPARWPWVAPGSLLATLIWIFASSSFSLYADNFGGFGATYGAIAAGVVLSLWMFLSALAILVGAELNAEVEHQTTVDSTIGLPRPMGKRGAAVADGLGRSCPPSGPRRLRDTLGGAVSDLTRKGKDKSKQGEASAGNAPSAEKET